MICKNGIKEYTVIGLLCAFVTVAGAIWLDDYSLTPSLLIGAAVGVAVPLVLFGCACYEEHYVKRLREKVESLEKIICEGWAHKGEIDGWLFLSDEALEFYPCNDEKEEYSISISDIRNIKITLFTIKVYASDEMCKFHVYRTFLWRKMIKDAIKA